MTERKHRHDPGLPVGDYVINYPTYNVFKDTACDSTEKYISNRSVYIHIIKDNGHVLYRRLNLNNRTPSHVSVISYGENVKQIFVVTVLTLRDATLFYLPNFAFKYVRMLLGMQ